MGSESEAQIHGHSPFVFEGLQLLLSHEGKVSITSVVEDTVCLFFSAQWCRPCRSFTPQLVQVYNQLKKRGESLQVIFVSFDKDEDSFLEHYKTMPWLALPFDNDMRRRICTHFKVNYIPALIPVNRKAIEADAVQLIEDYDIDAFPFTAEMREGLRALDEAKRRGSTLQALLANDMDHLITNDEFKIPVSTLMGKSVGLYFAANWSPPCRDFTSQLTRTYEDIKVTSNNEFEIVFVSSDKEKSAFDQSINTMPWLAIPFTNNKARHDLFRIFNIKAIPALVFISPNGDPVGTDGREMVTCYGADGFPFTEERAKELNAAVEKQREGLCAQVKDKKHKHVLKLEKRKAFICNGCANKGRFWSYCCRLCDFDLHPACVLEEKDTMITKEEGGDICIHA